MGSVYARGRLLWLSFYDQHGKRQQRSTELPVGEEAKARAILEEIEAQVAAGTVFREPRGGLTLERYAEQWINRRSGQIRTSADEATRLRKHVFPTLGRLQIDAVRARHIRDLILTLRDKRELAPRSIRHVHAAIRRLYRDAVLDEVAALNPAADLPSGILPPIEDKDPEWRSGAIFERAELLLLMSAPELLSDRRMLYGLKAAAGLRHGEAAALRWRHYDPKLKPLGRLVVANTGKRKGTKTGRTRDVPVHPHLAAMLGDWQLNGWAKLYGRQPTSGDLIVPTRNLTVRAAADAQNAFHRDLEQLGLRPRRGHDLRRTFISLARADGARKDILELVTHGARGDIISMYSTLPWSTLCAEVIKLDLPKSQPSVATVDATVKESPEFESEFGALSATPTGPHASWTGIPFRSYLVPRGATLEIEQVAYRQRTTSSTWISPGICPCFGPLNSRICTATLPG